MLVANCSHGYLLCDYFQITDPVIDWNSQQWWENVKADPRRVNYCYHPRRLCRSDACCSAPHGGRRHRSTCSNWKHAASHTDRRGCPLYVSIRRRWLCLAHYWFDDLGWKWLQRKSSPAEVQRSNAGVGGSERLAVHILNVSNWEDVLTVASLSVISTFMCFK